VIDYSRATTGFEHEHRITKSIQELGQTLVITIIMTLVTYLHHLTSYITNPYYLCIVLLMNGITRTRKGWKIGKTR